MSLLPLDVGAPDLATFFAQLPEIRSRSEHTHLLHPYPAKFIPEIPRALISALATPGGVVLDPMCGSGTTLVEASVEGHPAVGVDLNPIATLVTKAKCSPLAAEDRRNLEVLRRTVAEHAKTAEAGRALPGVELPDFHNRDKWFEPQALAELALLRDEIDAIGSAPSRALALATYSSIIVRASNQESETRWAAKSDEVLPGQVLGMFLNRLDKTSSMVAAYQSQAPASVTVYEADARCLPLDSNSIDLVVTSPPYANSHDYYLYNKLRLFWLERDVKAIQEAEIGSRNKISDHGQSVDDYMAEMGEVLGEIERVLAPARPACIVVSDAVIRGELHDMAALYEAGGKSMGLELERGYGFRHQPLNRAFQSGFGTRHNKTTHVLVFRKTH